MTFTSPMLWRCRGFNMELEKRALVMGILNVTPDSFSDGGKFSDPRLAAERALEMESEGAGIIDIGGESTRPGAEPVPAETEAERVIPVIRALKGRLRSLISVDTMKAGVAERALAEGAHVVNDVSALTHDPDMPLVVKSFGAGVVLMHMKGEPRTMQAAPEYADVVAEISAYLAGRIQALSCAGLDPITFAVDPGIGFGKTTDHNFRLLANIGAFARLGRPVVLGPSRKRFIGDITGREPALRLAGTLAAVVCAVERGARVVRVHDVRETADALRVLERVNLAAG